MNRLESLKKLTTVVSDTGEFEEIKKYQPVDGTTNPSLITSAASKPPYKHLIDEAVSFGKQKGGTSAKALALSLDKVFVNFGIEILKIVPGRVSTEVDARLSFDVAGSVAKAKQLIDLYEHAGFSRDRILIKLASTWEGIQAAKLLEQEKIHCNMTLLFSLPQAIACAEAKATLISPFVGRILDWYKKNEPKEYSSQTDPGVLSVTEIYHYYKHLDIQTQIMGASFRNSGEILELAGCDFLTIAPKLLEELQTSSGEVVRKLDPATSKKMNISRQHLSEQQFRWRLCENSMATEKLHEGIRLFAADLEKLENQLKLSF